MSFIDLHNYEGFLLDYSEGVLDAEKIAELKSFILSHPELEIDLEDLQLPYFAEETVSFESKEDLKKTSFDRHNEEVIAYLENTLSTDERIRFELLLKSDPTLNDELALYRKTILLPDEALVFDGKSDLIKTEKDLAGTEAYRVVAFVENIMSASERDAFERDLSGNTLLRKELDLILKTQLEADPALVFPNKELLKKKNRVFALYNTRTILRMAAAILLLFTFSFLLSYFGGKEEINLASVGSKKMPDHSTSAAVAIKQEKDRESVPVAEKLSDVSKERTLQGRDTKQQIKNTPFPSPQNISDNKEENKGAAKLKDAALFPSNANVEKQLAQLSPAKDIRSLNDTLNTAQFYSLALEEDEESTSDNENETTVKKGFWKRAVALAQQANKLGIKSVDGVESTHQKFRLSINNFSVEKR